jgi:acyl-CoA thioester hydrolase
MMKTETQIRVRYGETDQMGVVYHGNYALYFEQARTEALRGIDITYKSLEDSGIMMPVVSLHVDFKRSAKYDDLLTIKTRMPQLPTAKITLEYEVLNEAGVLLATGNSTLVFMDKLTNRPTRCPEHLYQKFNSFFVNE